VSVDANTPHRRDGVQSLRDWGTRIDALGKQPKQPRVICEHAVPTWRRGCPRVEISNERDVVDERAHERARGIDDLEALREVEEPAEARHQRGLAVVVPHRTYPAAATGGQFASEQPPARADGR